LNCNQIETNIPLADLSGNSKYP